MAYKKPPEIAVRPLRGLISQLPADGPGVPAPKWPLEAVRPGEQKRWDVLWQLPQAAMWWSLQSEYVVARYVRLVLRAEEAGSDGSGVTFQAEVRRMENELGLTPRAMHLLNLRVVEPQDSNTARSALQTQLYEAKRQTELDQYHRAVGKPGTAAKPAAKKKPKP